MNRIEQNLFALLRLGLGADSLQDATGICISPEDWVKLYDLASKLSVVGIAYAGICMLPKDRQPPLDLAFQWASEAETVRGHNRMVNREAANLTELFKAQGRRTAILKGAANARLYPDAFIRQCGDIDIWVEGGRESVVALLQDLGMMSRDSVTMKSFFFSRNKPYEELYAEAKEILSVSGHHVHLTQSLNGIEVEVHFKPSSGNQNPITNKRLQNYLSAEFGNVVPVPEGFCVPSLRFALAMQLSHIQRHLVTGGVGLKQVVDYFVLLQNASDEDRLEIAGLLCGFGLYRTCGALMWVLGQCLGLKRECMLCAPDARRGRRMLGQILLGGNFGFYEKGEHRSVVPRWLFHRRRELRFWSFAPTEVFWCEVAYWSRFLRSIPIRIKLRKFSIRDLF